MLKKLIVTMVFPGFFVLFFINLCGQSFAKRLSVILKNYIDIWPLCVSQGQRHIFDISKAFDGIWHEGLVYEVQSLGISGLPLKCIERFLSKRFQRVLLYAKSSSSSQVLAGMSQGSIIEPLLILVYFNDLSKNLSSIFQRKMSLNPQVTKQAQEIVFSCKSLKVTFFL